MSDQELKSILPINLEDEMRKSYLDYAMSVIVSRALPDVRDGLKPVHRRILYSMKEGGLDYNRPYRKSARVVGDVMGNYHPHGDLAIYNAMVRMAQKFSLSVPLIDGQGNFGSMDGDPAAAMRYTEARLSHPAHYMIEDIDKQTVDFQPNYDESTKEPTVLPAQFPNLLVNGAGGIAVGMATNIPPHNLGEVIEGCCAYVDNPEITIEELMTYIPGPDFPTGAQIMGQEGIMKAYLTGNGSIIIRAKSHFEQTSKDRECIVFTEVPYQVNKSKLMEKIAELVNSKTIEGISDLRDESDRDGVRMVVELKRDFDPHVILNQLYKYTQLQDSFGANMLALTGGRPQTMNLKDMISAFVRFREEVIVRRTKFELEKARDKGHTFVGLALAVSNIDEVIELIRGAPDSATAKTLLMERDWPVQTMGPIIRLVEEDSDGKEPTIYRLSEKQAKSILELRLHRLTGLERDKIVEELTELVKQIERFIFILSNRSEVLSILKEELQNIKQKFPIPRRSEIVEGEITTDIEHLIQKEDMVVTVSHSGYIKRVPLSMYRSQRRGGRGRSGMQTREEDFVDQLFVANTHTPILFFSSFGRAYVLKVYKLPIASAISKGKALINILPLEKEEKISTIMPLPTEEDAWENLQIVFATSKGGVRKNKLSDFLNIRANGKIAMKLEEEGEVLVSVGTCDENNDILLSTYLGKCIRFRSTDIRLFAGRNSTGVRGIKLQKDDYIVSMCILNHGGFTTEERDQYLKRSRALRAEGGDFEKQISDVDLSDERFTAMQEQEEFLLTVSERGSGKRTSSYEYRLTGRGGQGITNMDLSDKTGNIVACFPVADTDHLMLITDDGQMIRSKVSEIRIAGRRTQGVRVFRLSGDEKVVSAERILDEDEDEAEAEISENDLPESLDEENQTSDPS